LLLLAASSKGQTIDGVLYTNFNNYYKWRGGAFDSVLLLPQIAASIGRRPGALRYNTADSSVYSWTGTQWRRVGQSIDTTSLSNRIDLRVKYTDTAAMLSPYLRSNVAAATYQPIGNYVVSGSAASLQSLNITGTNGNGWIHLRHQASLPTATGQTTALYANSNGDLAYKNDGNYHTTFATSANTADRTYTFQNKSYTVADNADVVKYTDTSSMLSHYLRKVDTASLSSRIDLRVRYSDTASMLSPYLRSNVAAATYQLIFDTIPLAAFGAGSGAASDTAAFTTSAVYGSFYNAGNDTLIITQMRAGVLGTSPNITTEVYWNDSLNVTAGATILVTGGTSVTGTIGATNVTSFTNNKIPPNVWVFVRTSAVATKPTYFTLTLLGYKKRI